MQPDLTPDRQAVLERLMTQYGSTLLRMCTLHLRDAALAEDAVQDTFLKAYKRLDDLRDASRERSWLMSIAINTCRDYLRTAWLRHTDRRISLDLLPEPTCESIWPDATVITEVMSLPHKLREAVLLRYYQGMKLKEVADALHISPSTVKQRLDRANTILHSRLERWYFNED
ncbi:MAG: sigma-70 family RNA polymerase sigma factor [Clostridia bacterium]|nr:sigma-70 family RNA polymerase sigma factor [Clostridia bacterium]MBQ7845082.1 sigma-70 family RNA polymerase sigma factor [Clostridia bacterium]MBQ8313070.1 sigma-70 family RNA polymerase sigma factor [Clostridia bacterium]